MKVQASSNYLAFLTKTSDLDHVLKKIMDDRYSHLTLNVLLTY